MGGVNGKLLFYWNNEKNDFRCIQQWNSRSKFPISFSKKVIKWIKCNVIDLNNRSKQSIEFCTEIERNNVKYRCHPNFRGKGPWEDWVNVLYEDKTKQNIFKPAQLKCFFLF